MFTDLERTLLQAHGTDNQRERHAAGVLPEDELLTIARALLFEPFRELDLKRWSLGHDRREMERSIRHVHGKGCTHEHLGYEAAELDEATASEWDALKAITRLASAVAQHPWVTGCNVLVTAHWITCSRCNAEHVRKSAKVTIKWAGRSLVREYAL